MRMSTAVVSVASFSLGVWHRRTSASSKGKAGRQWFFEEATPDERTMTDDRLVKRLRELTTEAPHWNDPEGVWFFSIGCLLGEMSGHLFPLTDQERQQWQAEAAAFMHEYEAAHRPDQERREQDTESLTPQSILEYTI